MRGPTEAGRVRTVRAPWSVVVRSFAFLRKEVVEILRQPRLIVMLVVGPFALLLMFGYGYSEDAVRKRTIFVGPDNSIYDEVLDSYEEDLADFIDSQGMVPTVGEGRRALADGTADVVVVFPPDPQASVLAGERAVIDVLHDEIDPLQATAVEVAARLAVQEVNATVLTAVATTAQAELSSGGDPSTELAAIADMFASDPAAARDALRTQLAWLRPALDETSTVLGRLAQGEDDPAVRARWDAVEAARASASGMADDLAASEASTSDAELAALGEQAAALADLLRDTVVLDPAVLVRPFDSTTESVIPGFIGPTDYFTPASISLLLQHLALTFAALSLVRDRRTGLFELMRVGPLSSIEIVIGKIFAYLLVGSAVGAAIVAAAVFGLGVTFNGSVAWLAVVGVGLLLASLSLGMLLAVASRTESQAVQFAMLALLGGLFFSGFILPVDSLSYPVRIVSWLLPVTYGIDALQDIMLRGVEPERTTLVGLGALVAGYGVLAVVALRRKLVTAEGS
jgi:ABC-2 type transport system permease protein